MSKKKSLWDEINSKVKRKKELSAEIASRHDNVEAFVVEMIEEIEGALTSTVNTSLFALPLLRTYYVSSVEGRIRTLDNGCSIDVSWHEAETADSIPRINGILIKWSKEYQTEHKCEAELFVDLMSLLFK